MSFSTTTSKSTLKKLRKKFTVPVLFNYFCYITLTIGIDDCRNAKTCECYAFNHGMLQPAYEK